MPVYKDMDKRRADINRNVKKYYALNRAKVLLYKKNYTLYKNECLRMRNILID
jgi:hypothetical protein